MKDWAGNSNSAYVCIGASNHSDKEREQHDYYATPPKAVEELLKVEKFAPTIWECACGGGHISKVLISAGYDVISTDLIDRGFGKGNVDFLLNGEKKDVDIVTNPPYKYAKEFVEKALDTVTDDHKVAMLLKLQFLEGKARRKLFDKYPPQTVYVFSKRVSCAINGNFGECPTSAIAYAWYVWRKGYKGTTKIKWIN